MPTALVTGASSGIGAAFSSTLAQRGFDLILVARSQTKLAQMAEKFQAEQGISVMVLAQDLRAENAVNTVFTEVKSKGYGVDLLINNAGFGDYGLFAQSDRLKQLDMIDLNIRALVEMTHVWLPEMRLRQGGDIINVASIAGFQPMPYFSVYAATKAFVLSFSEALWAENQEMGIKVLALCPGPTESQFMEVANFPQNLATPGPSLVTSEEVVEAALKALARGDSNTVTGGLINQIVINAARFLPRSWIVNGIKRIMAPV
jgi:uncharacterized protein